MPESSPSAAELGDLLARVRLLEDDLNIRTTVTRMVGLVDMRDWEQLVTVFTPTVRADWSKLTSEPAGEVTVEALVDGWRRTLTGLTAIQHILGNILVTVTSETDADASAYVHAAQRLDADFASSLWIVAGTYDFHLVRHGGRWLISAATYRPAWGWGNRQIMDLAR
ncbi:nuclear transport factor 2 family protein [Microbacterium murale]|nr:nuclear transport factor 2 family protein [Microbacterium murale]